MSQPKITNNQLALFDLRVEAPLAFAPLPPGPGTEAPLPVPVPGATPSDFAFVTFAGFVPGVVFRAYVSAPGTVDVIATNTTPAPTGPIVGDFLVLVVQHS